MFRVLEPICPRAGRLTTRAEAFLSKPGTRANAAGERRKRRRGRTSKTTPRADVENDAAGGRRKRRRGLDTRLAKRNTEPAIPREDRA